MAALIAIETVVLVLLAVLVAGLLRSHADILRRLHDLGAGLGGDDSPTSQPVPFRSRPGAPDPAAATAADGRDITGTGLRGEAIALSVVGTTHDTLLAFLSSSCLTCERFWNAFRRPETLELPEATRLVVVAKDATEESPARLSELAAPGLDVLLSSQAWTDYHVPGSPYVVYVEGATGRILGQGTGMSWDQVAALLAQATGDLAFTTAPGRTRRGRKPASDAEREAAIDRQLLAAGIEPGDPSLYPEPEPPETAARPGPGPEQQP
jgi:hypothetical protein